MEQAEDADGQQRLAAAGRHLDAEGGQIVAEAIAAFGVVADEREGFLGFIPRFQRRTFGSRAALGHQLVKENPDLVEHAFLVFLEFHVGSKCESRKHERAKTRKGIQCIFSCFRPFVLS